MNKLRYELSLTLPVAIEKAAHSADQKVGQIMRHQEYSKNTKRGRPKKEIIVSPLKHFDVFVADSREKLEDLLNSHRRLVGAAYRGNKRRGKSALYADLLQFFISLKAQGITLPRNKSLSRKVCELGIGDILRRHGCTEESDGDLLRNKLNCRKKLAKKMNGIFEQIANEL